MFWEKFTIIRHPTECSFPMKKKSRARLRYGIHFWCLRNAKGIGPDLSNIVLVLPREYEWEGGVRLQSQIECLLEEMRIKLSSVASDLLSVGLCILWALARGGRPEEIGGFGRRALAASREEQLIDALAGSPQPMHRELLSLQLERLQLLHEQIARLNGMIAQALRPYQEVVAPLGRSAWVRSRFPRSR